MRIQTEPVDIRLSPDNVEDCDANVGKARYAALSTSLAEVSRSESSWIESDRVGNWLSLCQAVLDMVSKLEG